MIAVGLSKLQKQMVLQGWEECAIWYATPLFKVRNHCDFCYICSSLELPDVHDEIYGNTHGCPSYLTAVPAKEFCITELPHCKYCHLEQSQYILYRVQGFAGSALAQINSKLPGVQ